MDRLTRSLSLGVLLVTLIGTPARACSNVHGIPGDCQMETWRVPTGAGGAAPQRLTSVLMNGNWTYHAYELSPDGQSLLVHLEDGFEIHRAGQPPVRLKLDLPFTPRDVSWDPDSRRVAFWVAHAPPGGQRRKAVALLDVTALGAAPPGPDEVPYEVLYAPDEPFTPSGFAWAPDGQGLLVLEVGVVAPGGPEGRLTRVEVEGRAARTLAQTAGPFDFFFTPFGCCDHRLRPRADATALLLGHETGLHAGDQAGSDLRRLPLPSKGVHNLDWQPVPGSDLVALFFRRPARTPDGRTFVGVHLARLAEGAAAPEQVHDATNVHTLWFSPRGTHVGWASDEGVWYRRVEGPPGKTVHVPAPEGAPIKGFTWHDDEDRLAFTAGDALFVHDLAAKSVREVWRAGRPETSFLAEPRFVGDDVLVSRFEDVSR
ncbi:MAG: hypothetical protein KF878_02390 [Planctomycetes bacterium]|nr:hypothetical protein [Planctomycetota bacterium]